MRLAGTSPADIAAVLKTTPKTVDRRLDRLLLTLAAPVNFPAIKRT